MKKAMKSFWVLAAGLSLVLAGCTGDNGDPDGELDARDGVVGNYNVYVYVGGPGAAPITTPLTVSKDGEGLKVEAVVTVSALPTPLNIALQLSELKEVTLTPEVQESTGSLTGLVFKIAAQPIAVPGIGSINFAGVEMLEDADPAFAGYAGYIGNLTLDGATRKMIMFGISGEVPMLGALPIIISSEEITSGEVEEPDGEITGTYQMTAVIDELSGAIPAVPATLEVTENGDDLKVSADLSLLGAIGAIDLSLNLTSLEAFTQEVEGVTYSGYFFKIEEQTVTLPSSLGDINFTGTGDFALGGVNYDGLIALASVDGEHTGKELMFRMRGTPSVMMQAALAMAGIDVDTLTITVGQANTDEE